MTYFGGKDLARTFRVVRKNTIQVAHDIPEDQYGFRATPATRSVAEMLAHIAACSRWPHRLHGVNKKTFMSFDDFGAYMKDTHAYEATLTTKADIVAALEANGEQFAAFLESLTDDVLGEIVRFPPPIQPAEKTRFELLQGVKEHEMHHRAQLMLVERLVGVVPHLTRAREERAAART